MKKLVVIIFIIFIVVNIFSHPHIFIENKVNFNFKENYLESIDIEWKFDRSTSYLYIEVFSEFEKNEFSQEEIDEIEEVIFHRLSNFDYFVELYINGKKFENILPEKFTVRRIPNNVVIFNFSVPLNIEFIHEEAEMTFYFTDTSFYSKVNNDLSNFTINNNSEDLFINLTESIDTNKVFYLEYVPVEKYIFIIKNKNPIFLYEYEKEIIKEIKDEEKKNDNLIEKEIVEEDIVKKAENVLFSSQKNSKIDIFKIQSNIMDRFVDIIESFKEEKSLVYIILILFLAFLYGVIHGIGPGHGKTVAMSYFITEDSKYIKSVMFGGLFSLTQFIMTTIFFFVAYYGFISVLYLIDVDSNTKIIQLFGNFLILIISLYMLIKILFIKNKNNENKSEKNLFVVAASIGLVPCPGIMLVLLISLSLDMILFGILTAFFTSLGISITVIMSGFLTQFAVNKIERIMKSKFLDKIQKVAPFIGYSLLLIISLTSMLNNLIK
jgi:ABC-type nickel/cobalt efflux system permease component RcnA/ABC-type uncharacterized transport system substrate-binding protein